MSHVETRILPLLPLSTGVVLPQMVIPLSLESDEAKAAADAAVDGMLILVPRRETTTDDGGTTTTYARVGTVAKIEEAGRLPGGGRAVLVRGLQRAVVGVGVPGAGPALRVEVALVDEEPGAEGEQVDTLVREYRAVVEAILEHRKAPWLAEALRGITDPSAHGRLRRLLPRPVLRAQGRAARDRRRDRAPGQGPGLGQGDPGRPRAEAADPHRRVRGDGEAPAGLHPPPADGRHPQGAGRGRRRRRRGVPRPPGGTPRGGAGRRRAGGGPPGAHQRAEPRALLDPHLARPPLRAAVGQAVRRPPRPARKPGASSTRTTPASTT